jgi:hypothetical protein
VQGASELADLWRRLVLKVGCELAEPCQVSVGIPAQVDVMDAFFGDPTGAGLQLGSPATSKPLVALFAILGCSRSPKFPSVARRCSSPCRVGEG